MASRLAPPPAPLLESDPHAGFLQAALKLRERRFHELDVEQLADEIEDMGRSIRRELRSDLARLVEHLLKLDHATNRDPVRGWRVSVREHRRRVLDLLSESPSLKSVWDDVVSKAWESGRDFAEAGLSEADASGMPAELPYPTERLLDRAYFGERDAAA